MNKFIKEQLDKCKIVLPEYDDTTVQLFIPKNSKHIEIKNEELDIVVGMCYTIEVEHYIIAPYEGFTLHQNWNKGVVPTDSLMNCEVTQIMGKMVKVNAIGVHDGKSWEGWLPRKSIKSIKAV